MKFYLMRERAFEALFPGERGHPDDSPLKKGTAILLERNAQKLRLQHGSPQYQRIITPVRFPLFEEIDQVEADHWLAAESQLGYTLTPAQKAILAAHRTQKILDQRAAA